MFCRALALPAFLILLTSLGCGAVSLDEPLGQLQKPEDVHRFVGEWEFIRPPSEEEHSERVHIRMLKNGRLSMARIRWDQLEEKFVVITHLLVPTELGDWSFLNLKLVDSDKIPSQFFLARYEWLDDDRIEVQYVDFEQFKKAIDEEHLKGIYQKDDERRLKTIHLAAEDLEKWLKEHPDFVDKLFHSPLKNEEKNIITRVRKADDNQRDYSPYIVEPK